jgi:predicted GNAT family N-acyltransferase
MTASAAHPFRVCQSLDDMLKALAVRSIVFCEEQEVPYRLEYGDGDLDAVHIIGIVDEEPATAARLRFFGQYAKLERIAVRKRYRGQNLGHALVDYMIGLARERGYRKFKLSAQVHLESFYAAHGFVALGEYFVDAGIDHSMMMREDPEA